jgi:hypothetical protein
MRLTRKKGGGLFDLTDCKYLETLSIEDISTLVGQDKLRVESMQQTFDRVYVFLYLKLKQDPILTDENIMNSYSTPNDTRFPLKLERGQFNELRTLIMKNSEKTLDEIAIQYFKTELTTLDNQIHNWERRNKVVYRGNECFIGNKAGGYFARTVADIKLTDRERQDKINRDEYGCVAYNPKTNSIEKGCIFITNSLQTISHDPINRMYWICINGIQNSVSITYEHFAYTRIVMDGFSNGNIAGVNPRFGLRLIKEYPDLWAQKMWLSTSLDDIDKIVILTLQKYSAIRRYYGASYVPVGKMNRAYDQSWSSYLYKQDPFEPSTAYELKNPQIEVKGYQEYNNEKFLEELIDNQIWAMTLNETYYNRIKAKGNTYGIRYKTLKDLDRLLPTPHGFKPKFFWQVYDSKNMNKPKTKMRHKNILYHISTVKRNRNREGAKIARKMGNTWSNIERMKHAPQYATQESIDSYYKNFNSGNSFLPPGLSNVQRRARPKRGVNNAPRATFQPTTIRHTRKNRR